MKTLDEIRTIIRQHQDVLAEKYGVAVVGQNMQDAEEFVQGLSYNQFVADKRTFNAVVRSRRAPCGRVD